MDTAQLVMAALCLAYLAAMHVRTHGRLVRSGWIWLAAAALCVIVYLFPTLLPVEIVFGAYVAYEVARTAAVALRCARVQPYDAEDVYLIVFGAQVRPDGTTCLELERRTRAAFRWWQRNPAARIVASGGQGANEPTSEACAIHDLLLSWGVPENAIVLEDASTSTWENLINSKTLIPAGAHIGLVSSNFHMRRILLLAQRAGLQNTFGVPCQGGYLMQLHYLVREALALTVLRIRAGMTRRNLQQ